MCFPKGIIGKSKFSLKERPKNKTKQNRANLLLFFLIVNLKMCWVNIVFTKLAALLSLINFRQACLWVQFLNLILVLALTQTDNCALRQTLAESYKTLIITEVNRTHLDFIEAPQHTAGVSALHHKLDLLFAFIQWFFEMRERKWKDAWQCCAAFSCSSFNVH